MSINAQIRKLEMENFKTKPLNRPVYINPFLLKSDAQILTDIYNKKTTPPIMADKKLKNKDGDKKKDDETTTAPDTSSQQSTDADAPSTTPASTSDVTTPHGNVRGGNAAEAPATATQADAPPRQVDDAATEEAAAAANDAASAANRPNAGAAPPADEGADTERAGGARLGEGSVSDLPNENIIANSPGGAGNTMAHRMRTASANFNNDGVTLRSANTQVTATHPPIVPVTDRITNNVGISNSLLSSLYDKLPASSKTKLTTRAGSSGFLSAAQHPELQTIFPAQFRRNHQVQTYRITSAGNVYAYVYGGQSRPIYIGNWRESYGFNHPPAYQPANPHGTTARAAPVSTQLGNTGTHDQLHLP
jgi:hypothetical protein